MQVGGSYCDVVPLLCRLLPQSHAHSRKALHETEREAGTALLSHNKGAQLSSCVSLPPASKLLGADLKRVLPCAAAAHHRLAALRLRTTRGQRAVGRRYFRLRRGAK